MDFYLKPGNSRRRLLEEYKRYGSLVIAFDFDDTVYDFHKKGRSWFCCGLPGTTWYPIRSH